MLTETPSWAVVATVDEPPALLQAFVAWHLSLGAAQVFLYLDRPSAAGSVDLTHLPQVTVVACDAAHWQRFGKPRPHRHEIRQVRNAQDAYQRTAADWILHCDADEYLRAAMPVADILAGIEAETECFILGVAERVHPMGKIGAGIFDGAFRRPFQGPAKRGAAIFGADFTMTNRGLTGHAQGKAFVRTGRGLHMSIHRPRRPKAGQEVVSTRATNEVLELLHFEGLTPHYWFYKLSRMIQALNEDDGMPPSAHRRRQAEALMAAPELADGLYHRLKSVDAPTIKALVERGLWDDRAFDPAPVVARYFAGQVADASPQAIDDWLATNKTHVTDYLQK
ncbi:glycosyl transferase family 2 [Loktanella sp. PT4BL]|jgi:hypothetical protein|nr:glycosyl transferase family 2 [Loktanella sp. PT4BL]